MSARPSRSADLPRESVASASSRYQPAYPELASVEELLAELQAGRMTILIDDENRENEGDLVIPAQACTAEIVNFMATHARGLICLALTEQRCRDLRLPAMPQSRGHRRGTAFTVSIEAREGVTTGISAADRARTIEVAANPAYDAKDLTSPGHVFPLAARDGGVLVRPGHTEAAVDLTRLAGFEPAAVICEIMNDDGSMARLPDLLTFGSQFGLKVGTIADLMAYRLRHDRIVEHVTSDVLDSRHGGIFRVHVYEDRATGTEHVALVKGDVANGGPVPVRAHRVDLLDDLLGAEGNERAGTLHMAMESMSRLGRGVILLVHDDLGGAMGGTIARVAPPTQESELRQSGIGAQIIRDLGIRDVVPLTEADKNILGGAISGLRLVDLPEIVYKLAW